MKKIFAPVLAALMLLPLLCGCGTGTAEAELTTVRLNEVTHSVFYAPQYVAMELGFFADEGLAIELTNGGGADKVMTAVVSGQSDIGLAGPESCIYIYNQGKDDHPVVFGQLTACDGAFLMGREDVSFNWEDLRGKTIIGGRKGGVRGDDAGIRAAPARSGAAEGRDRGHQRAVQHDGWGLYRRAGRLCDAV